MLNIVQNFPITESEFTSLTQKFANLCWHIAHGLKKKNSNNNYLDDAEDINQELQLSMLRAGSYYKRQVYIEKCLSAARKFVKNNFVSMIVDELENLWKNRTRHGANRQKYGLFQEKVLDKIINKYVPPQERPDRLAPLVIDSKFVTYCKAIVWNGQKSMGKKITREKSIRSGMVSLSEFEFLN
jgi:hypothetical protein